MSRFVIHAVGPRYNPKYETAAESALYNAYRHALTVAKEVKARTVALSCIYLQRKGYPRRDASHIALRKCCT
jgi:O-acetyl-ADP-ribose deacetylase (regulator of RNase III)